MKNIPDLILEEDQPTFFIKKGKTSKWFSLYKKIIEAQEYMWYKLTEIEDDNDVKTIRSILSNTGQRSAFLRENIFDKGYILEIHSQREDGITKVWIRKIKKM